MFSPLLLLGLISQSKTKHKLKQTKHFSRCETNLVCGNNKQTKTKKSMKNTLESQVMVILLELSLLINFILVQKRMSFSWVVFCASELASTTNGIHCAMSSLPKVCGLPSSPLWPPHLSPPLLPQGDQVTWLDGLPGRLARAGAGRPLHLSLQRH